jgi:3-keto-disaccharide hydrolase
MKKCLSGILFFLLLINSNSYSQDNSLTPKKHSEGWKVLFDGTTHRGWKGAFIDSFPSKGWSIENGMLIVEPSEGKESTNGGDIVTIDLYDDFELQVDFKITPGANSGIKYFVDPSQPVPANPRSALGLEFQVLDDSIHPDAKLGRMGNRTLGSLYDLIPARASKPVNPTGQWNTARIISKGNHVEHWLNGVKLLEYERDSESFKKLIAESKYKDLPGFGLVKTGRILLQDHGNKVFFKNIYLKKLK